MALDVNRWLQYAKARLDRAVGQGNASLDRLEAEREAEAADKPWLRAEGEAPTLDEARARIEWEAERQAQATGGRAATSGTPSSSAAPSGDPQDRAAAAEAESARLQLEAQERASAERLAAIREELGVDAPAPPDDGGPPTT